MKLHLEANGKVFTLEDTTRRYTRDQLASLCKGAIDYVYPVRYTVEVCGLSHPSANAVKAAEVLQHFYKFGPKTARRLVDEIAKDEDPVTLPSISKDEVERFSASLTRTFRLVGIFPEDGSY
jgi:hypothetical protein